MIQNFKEVLVTGDGKLACSIVVNLLEDAGKIYFLTNDETEAERLIQGYINDLVTFASVRPAIKNWQFVQRYEQAGHVDLAIVITAEDEMIKKQKVQQLEKELSSGTIIAINSESISLESLQEGCQHPSRVFGLNWTLPAHSTAFLEIITNELTCPRKLAALKEVSGLRWGKDPFVLYHGYGIRARFMAAMTREAFFLVDNGYVSIEDVDRVCRNDAGYYLPFAGNCRYMDLMGTHAYGLVMKDLNKELSRETVPDRLLELVSLGRSGMNEGKGFYSYTLEEAEAWEEKFRKFSFGIKEIMDKYPFSIRKEEMIDSTVLKAGINE